MLKKGKWQWTVKDVQDLHRLHAQNMTDAGAAKVLGCKNEILVAKAKQLNLVFRCQHFWSKRRVLRLRQLLIEGYTRMQIAHKLETSRDQVLAQLMIEDSFPIAAKAIVFALIHLDREASLLEISEASGYSPVLVQKILAGNRSGERRCACACNPQRIAKMRHFMRNGMVEEKSDDAQI